MSLRTLWPVLMLCAVVAGCQADRIVPSPTSVVARQPATSTIPAPTRTPTEALPEPSPTLPPAPRQFTETFDAPPPHWAFLQVGNGQAFAGPVARDGFLVFDLAAANQWAYAVYGGVDYSDVLVQAAFQFRTQGDGAAGLICRYDEQAGWYELEVFADQTYQLLFGQWLARSVARYTPLFRGTSEAIRPDANEIALECDGNLLAPSINGLPLRKWSEQRYVLKEGAVGLSASSFAQAPFAVAYDRVTVGEP